MKEAVCVLFLAVVAFQEIYACEPGCTRATQFKRMRKEWELRFAGNRGNDDPPTSRCAVKSSRPNYGPIEYISTTRNPVISVLKKIYDYCEDVINARSWRCFLYKCRYSNVPITEELINLHKNPIDYQPGPITEAEVNWIKQYSFYDGCELGEPSMQSYRRCTEPCPIPGTNDYLLLHDMVGKIY